MKKSKTFLATIVVIFFVLCFTGTAAAATESNSEPVDRPVADVAVAANGIGWSPKVEFAKLVLNVSMPDGSVLSKTFEAGSTPYLEPSDDKGNYLPDGSYTYELRVIPFTDKKVRPSGQAVTPANAENVPKKALTQTGYFMVRAGKFVTMASPEGLAKPLDIVHLDDVIIDGSLCVGNDCYSGLAFGFDTIVLMENNLRIFFDDTSTIQNYPRNDWRIICNDSTDGGGKYFAIEDATEVSNIFVLEAGAPDNSLYVDSHGDVGINTSTPYYELHIVDGDSPCVRLDQDGSYGWEPQKWDLCGNESNFFIRDATHASKLPFRIEPEAPTDSIFIKSNGHIGLGTGSPSCPLEIETTGENAKLVLERTSGAEFKLNVTSSMAQIGSTSNHKVNFVTNNSAKMTLDTTGYLGIGDTSPGYPIEVTIANGAYLNTSGNWVNPSSRTLKENIRSLTTEEAVDTLSGLNPVMYNYKVDKTETCAGFIAEDVPDLVAVKNRKGMVTMDVVAVLTKVLQEQQKTISELKAEIAQLKKIVLNP
ncbi:MAG: tail fiber domain-containing protein [bacterium]|nr:tail fiber domain-containing protein [bacterium]